MEPVSSALLLKALDGLSARAAATAENVANSATPNYRPAEVRFERMLAAAAHGGADAVRAVKPQLERHSSPDGVRLDLELANASTTAMRYAALVELLGRQIQLHSLSISGNR